MRDDSLRAALAGVVGAAHVHTQGDMTRWCRDWRGRYEGRALAVVQPGTTAEVAAVVRCCADAGAAIVPQGGNTGLVGGGVPDASGTQVLLSLTRLARIRRVDADNLTLTTEAGCVLAQVQQAAADAGLLFPLSLGAEGSCTIGGNLATNAGGTQVLRYGTARALCLGLEVVTPQGEVWSELAGLRKDNTGYALRDLFIGAEGTLGVITAATLSLFARPRASRTALVACADLSACVALLRQARGALDAGLTGFEVMGGEALALVAQHLPELTQPLPQQVRRGSDAPWTVLLEAVGTQDAALGAAMDALLGDALASGTATDAVLAQSLAQAQGLWALREAIPTAQRLDGANVKHDISLPVSAIPAFVAETNAAVTACVPGVRMVTYGHLGDGNLHHNVQAPLGQSPAAFLAAHEEAVNALVYDAVARHGGSISAEHGIGQLKRAHLAQHKPPVALAMMRAIKAALDPQGLMNPGRVL